MICNSKYLYKVELITTNDILEFARIASKCPYDVTLVNGKHRLNAKSFLGVTDHDCYFEFEKFIK